MPYKLVKDYISHDLVEALETLLQGARTGEVTGIAFAAVLRQRRYITNVAGWCFNNPTFTRGAVCSLDDELNGMINGRDPNETR